MVAGRDAQERVPGKGPRGRQKAELGRQWEGVGHQGCEQMEGICFAELNSAASEVWKNLMGMVSSYLGYLVLFPHHFSSSLRRGEESV